MQTRPIIFAKLRWLLVICISGNCFCHRLSEDPFVDAVAAAKNEEPATAALILGDPFVGVAEKPAAAE